MEIRMPPKISGYKESVFLGLSYRQFFCSVLCIGTATGIYFLTQNILGKEIASWICLIGASPFALMGFFKYNKMTAEQLLWAMVLTLIRGKRRVYRAQNLLQDTKLEMEQNIETEELEE